jgi:hypothetical protein
MRLFLLFTFVADVKGISQCPIPVGESFNYEFIVNV